MENSFTEHFSTIRRIVAIMLDEKSLHLNQLTRGFGGFHLCWSACTGKDVLSVKSLLRLFGVTGLPVCYKGATSVQLCVFVSDDRNILQRPKTVKSWENILFVHCLWNLKRDTIKQINVSE